MARIKFDLYYNTESDSWEAIDPVTGEVKTFSSTVKKGRSKSSNVENSEPVLKLDSNKYTLSQAAADLLAATPDNRISIKFEKQGKKIIPIIGKDDVFGTKSGNKLTKSLTVSCRGKANEELSVYGDTFTFEPHPTKEGLFILCGNKEVAPVKNDIVEIDPEDDADIVDELDDLLNSEDVDNVKEITNFDFNI